MTPFAPCSELALSHRVNRDYAESIQLYREAIDLHEKKNPGQYDRHTLIAMRSLAAMYRRLDRNQEALEWSKRAFELLKAKLGVHHDETLSAMRDLALSHREDSTYEEAIQLYQDAIAFHKKKNGGQHDRISLRAMGRLARLYRELGNLSPAIKLLEKTLDHQRKVLGPDDSDTVLTVEFLAMWCRSAPDRAYDAKRYTEALIELMERARAPNRFAFMSDSAVWLAHSPDADDRSRAVELAQQVVDADSNKGMGWHVLGIAQLRMEQYPQAVSSLTRADELLPVADRSHRFLLAIAEAKQGNHSAARTWYDKANEWLKFRTPRESERLADLRDEASKALGITSLETDTAPDESSPEAPSSLDRRRQRWSPLRPSP